MTSSWRMQIDNAKSCLVDEGDSLRPDGNEVLNLQAASLEETAVELQTATHLFVAVDSECGLDPSRCEVPVVISHSDQKPVAEGHPEQSVGDAVDSNSSDFVQTVEFEREASDGPVEEAREQVRSRSRVFVCECRAVNAAGQLVGRVELQTSLLDSQVSIQMEVV